MRPSSRGLRPDVPKVARVIYRPGIANIVRGEEGELRLPYFSISNKKRRPKNGREVEKGTFHIPRACPHSGGLQGCSQTLGSIRTHEMCSTSKGGGAGKDSAKWLPVLGVAELRSAKEHRFRQNDHGGKGGSEGLKKVTDLAQKSACSTAKCIEGRGRITR